MKVSLAALLCALFVFDAYAQAAPDSRIRAGTVRRRVAPSATPTTTPSGVSQQYVDQAIGQAVAPYDARIESLEESVEEIEGEIEGIQSEIERLRAEQKNQITKSDVANVKTAAVSAAVAAAVDVAESVAVEEYIKGIHKACNAISGEDLDELVKKARSVRGWATTVAIGSGVALGAGVYTGAGNVIVNKGKFTEDVISQNERRQGTTQTTASNIAGIAATAGQITATAGSVVNLAQLMGFAPLVDRIWNQVSRCKSAVDVKSISGDQRVHAVQKACYGIDEGLLQSIKSEVNNVMIASGVSGVAGGVGAAHSLGYVGAKKSDEEKKQQGIVDRTLENRTNAPTALIASGAGVIGSAVAAGQAGSMADKASTLRAQINNCKQAAGNYFK
ncbi:MAG: hypothetical protein FWD15_04970 [Alphaproteobacteria bacterium]|nr:hypothetical protein [Alphaproteobacteria bacterium]